MDIQSSEAKLLESAFNRSRMRTTAQGFENTETHALYAKTNQGRFIRHDLDWDQYNVLAADRQAFMPVDTLRANETIAPRAFGRADLLPPRTTWEYTRDNVLPALGFSLVFAGGTWALHHFFTGLPAAATYVKEHLPGHRVVNMSARMSANHPGVANIIGRAGGGIAPVAPSHTAGVSAGLRGAMHGVQAAYYDDTDYNDAMSFWPMDDAYDVQQRRDEQTAFCALNPDQCVPNTDHRWEVAGAVVIGVGTGVGGTRLYDAMMEDETSSM
ncbi:MAG: hypothetical protein ACRYGR_01950 [Janthinobacterium lividum]